MMNRLLQIAILALAWPQLVAPASAVSVPQTSVSDYIFSRPVLTNHIRGVVVDTANPYRVIRSEDVDWLREAFAERIAISTGRIGRPSTGVGARVRKADIQMALNETGWLDADAPLLSGTRLVPASLTTTNTYAQTTYTNAWTNALSLITMPMTNGTVSVHTNSWRVQKRVPVESVATNVHGWTCVDFCHGVDGVPFPVYSNATKNVWGYGRESIYDLPTITSIDYARDILRGTKRLADDVVATWTNSVRAIYEWQSDAPSYDVDTNIVGTCTFHFNAGSYSAEMERTEPFTAVVPTRFSSSLVTTGGANRVSIEAVFARCHFSYIHFSGSDTDTHINTDAVVRLGESTLDLSGTKAFCRVPMSAYGICSACASAASVPSPPSSVEYRTSEDTGAVWDFSLIHLILFYSITPSVKLPDW